MKQSKLTQALGLGLVMMIGAGAALAADGQERVWVKFKNGGKGNVEQALRNAGGDIHYTFDNLNAFAVSLPSQAIQGLRNNPNIELIEEDPIRAPMAQTVPFGIDMVQAIETAAAGADGSGVLVCVVDSGLYTGHEDIQGVANITGGNAGWDTDTCGHGTHVAGTIAAVNNTTGVLGVSPGKVDLHIVRVFSGGTDGCSWTFSSGLIAAVDNCAAAANGRKVVVNMSLGGGQASTTERNGFDSLFAQGVLSIAAAGNGGNTQFSYPASYDSVISVAAIDSSKALASFSQRNSQVELAAPGVSVLSTVPWSAASLTVGADSFQVAAMDLTFQGTASGALVNGGLCDSVGSWAGRVVLCERGNISFGDKVSNASAGGAVAAVIYNNAPGGFAGTLGTASSIPAVSATQEDGQFLVANRLGSTANVSTIFTAPGSGYEAWDGTSMATPHVVGVAALLWSAHPTASNQAIRDVMAATAQDLGAAGRDTSFGFGLVQAKAALDALDGGGTEPPPPADVAPSSLSATVLKGRNGSGTLLNWTVGSASTVDVYRNNAIIATVANTGSFTDSYVGAKRSTATFKVCIQGSSTACSNEASVRF
jgi:subtilisin family serine protease